MMESGLVLFCNFWNIFGKSNYIISNIPGVKKNISGSAYSGFNVGINKNISNDKKDAAIKVIEFFTSEEVQKNIIVKKFNLYSGIKRIYKDNEVCEIVDCKLIKKIQPLSEPIFYIQNYDFYSGKVMKLLYEFFNGAKLVNEVLNDINDITKIYYYSYNTPVGLAVFIIILIIFYLILFSITVLFIPRFKIYFKFLSLDLWILYSFASIFYLNSEILYFGKLTEFKCEVSHIIMITGSTIYFIPILHKLIINFPKRNKISEFIKNHKLLFVFFIISIQGILNLILIIISPFGIQNIMLENEKNFALCMIFDPIGNIIAQIQIIINLSFYFCTCILIFIEWNIKETYKDIRALTVVMCVDGISQLLLSIIIFLQIKNYIVYYTLNICINLLYVLMNHIYIFIIRIWLENSNKKSEQEVIEEKLFNYNTNKGLDVLKSNPLNGIIDVDNRSFKSNNTSRSSKSFHNKSSKLLELHFATSQE